MSAAPQGPRRRLGRPTASLYARLALALLVLLTLLAVAWVVTTVVTSNLYHEEVEQRLNRSLAQQLLSDTEILDQGVREEDVKHIFHVLMVVNPRIEVYLLDAEGRILSYSAPEGRVVRERVDLEPVRAFLAGGRLPIRGDDPRHREGRKIFSAAPIPSPGGDGPDGYLYVVLGGERYDSVLAGLRSNWVLRLAVTAGLGALLVALALGLLLFRRLTRRLERLDRRIRTFHREPVLPTRYPGPPAAGEARPGDGPPTLTPPGDEIDRLEAAFNRMAERIESQIGELAALDELRRQLVANVSHDLRTPIAALQGYLETLLLKEESLPEAERRRYLEIALRHAEQLGKLVAQLFELARLEVEEAKLELEPASMAELAQDVVQKFHLEAERHGIALEARLPSAAGGDDGPGAGPLQPFVRADIRLLERALDNLLENALAHTPPGGRVTLAVEAADGGVRVRLADTGRGIPPEDLPRIFDRFHRGRDPGRRERPGAGLGLAITRRILELHGAALQVESAVDVGTTFTFQLPPAPS